MIEPTPSQCHANEANASGRRPWLDCLLPWLLSVVTWSALGAGGPLSAQAQPGVDRPPLVIATQVVQQPVADVVPLVASVLPRRRSLIGAPVEGRVEVYLHPVEGTSPGIRMVQVQAGDTIAQLKTDTISLELGAAEAEAERLRQVLLELQNGARPEERELAEATFRSAEAKHRLADSRLRRARQLHERQSLSQDELETVEEAAISARLAFEKARIDRQLVLAGPRVEQVAQAEAALAGQQQAVERLRTLMNKHTIRAPFDGFVVSEFTEVGAWLSRGDPIVELIQLSEVELEAAIPEDHVTKVAVGQQVSVHLNALPDDGLTAVLERIIPQADVNSRTFPLRFRMANQVQNGQPRVKSGMLGHVLLPMGRAQQAMLVPKDAVVLGDPGPRLMRLLPPDSSSLLTTVNIVPVVLGVPSDDHIQVTGDIATGDLVVIEGNERLRDGQQVRFVLRESPRRNTGRN